MPDAPAQDGQPAKLSDADVEALISKIMRSLPMETRLRVSLHDGDVLRDSIRRGLIGRGLTERESAIRRRAVGPPGPDPEEPSEANAWGYDEA